MFNGVCTGMQIVADLVLPKPQDGPATLSQSCGVYQIARHGALDLVAPVRLEFVPPRFELPTVPEITVHEYSDHPPKKDDVGSARERVHMYAIPQSAPMQFPSKSQLRTRVFAANARHGPTTLLARHVVWHQLHIILLQIFLLDASIDRPCK